MDVLRTCTSRNTLVVCVSTVSSVDVDGEERARRDGGEYDLVRTDNGFTTYDLHISTILSLMTSRNHLSSRQSVLIESLSLLTWNLYTFLNDLSTTLSTPYSSLAFSPYLTSHTTAYPPTRSLISYLTVSSILSPPCNTSLDTVERGNLEGAEAEVGDNIWIETFNEGVRAAEEVVLARQRRAVNVSPR